MTLPVMDKMETVEKTVVVKEEVVLEKTLPVVEGVKIAMIV